MAGEKQKMAASAEVHKKDMDEFVRGGKEIQLRSWKSKVFVEELSMETLLPFVGQISKLSLVREAIDKLVAGKGTVNTKAIVSMLVNAIPELMKLPALLGHICGHTEKWFARLPLDDELLIVETILDISDLERVLPRFFVLCRRIGNLNLTMPAGSEGSGN